MRVNEAEALKWVATVFEEPVEKISRDTPRDQIAAWDSLGILTLMAALDQDFGLVLPAGEVQDWRNVGEILDMLQRRGWLVQ